MDPKVFGRIDISTMRALHNPRLPADHPNAFFLDHASTDELRAKYLTNALMAQHLDQIVDVDYVWKPGRTLAQVVGDDAPFDFVVASHVIEHIANPVGWLGQLAEILRPGGIVSLIVPDKRYCFDARRQVTTVAQWIDAHLRELDRPTFQQIYDHEANYAGEVDTVALWDGLDPRHLRRDDVDDPDRFAYERCVAAAEGGEYVDVHCSTFTPTSFLDLTLSLVHLDLLPFGVARVLPTEPGSFEFHVWLERFPDDIDPIERRRRGIAACDAAYAAMPNEVRVGDEPISQLEQRMVLAKRGAMRTARSAVARLRRR
jgi:SAM-dependent methyltransferase